MRTDDIKERVLLEIEKTRNKISDYKEMTQPIAPDDAIGRITRMDAINNKSVNESSLRVAETKLVNLNRVLEMYGKEGFGKCVKCKREIPIERILFMPQSLYCVICAK